MRFRGVIMTKGGHLGLQVHFLEARKPEVALQDRRDSLRGTPLLGLSDQDEGRPVGRVGVAAPGDHGQLGLLQRPGNVRLPNQIFKRLRAIAASDDRVSACRSIHGIRRLRNSFAHDD